VRAQTGISSTTVHFNPSRHDPSLFASLSQKESGQNFRPRPRAAHPRPRENMANKPSVLIIGGLGYIGRFLALHIHQNDLASDVRIVDKVLPQLAWLAPEFDEACAGSKFMQADASRERMVFLSELALLPCLPPPFAWR